LFSHSILLKLTFQNYYNQNIDYEQVLFDSKLYLFLLTQLIKN